MQIKWQKINEVRTGVVSSDNTNLDYKVSEGLHSELLFGFAKCFVTCESYAEDSGWYL